MNENINILCVDDIAEDKSNSRFKLVNLISRSNHDIDINIRHPNDLEEVFNEAKVFDLVIIDYFLEKHAKNGTKFKHKGNALIGLLREQFTGTPIYLISADMPKCKGFIPSDNFENYVTDEWLADSELIKSEVLSHREIKEQTINNYDDLHSLLQTPEGSKEFIEKALPNQIRRKISKSSSPYLSDNYDLNPKINILLSRWITHELLLYPGILYNSLHTATLLGIDHDHFNQTLANDTDFNNAAIYKGVFKDSFEKLWWKDAIIEYLYSQPNAEDNMLGTIYESALKILKISDENIAICHKCLEKGANTIAHITDYPEKEYSVHYSCSVQDTSSLPIPYFDPQRVLLEDK